MDLLLSDTRLRYMDADESMGNANWILGDLRSLHRCVPALRRTGITTYSPPPSARRAKLHPRVPTRSLYRVYVPRPLTRHVILQVTQSSKERREGRSQAR